MAAASGITTSGQPPTAVVNVQPGMNVQAVVLVDQNGQYVTPGGASTTAGSLATTTVPVNVAAATAPTTGQALIATSGTTATWQIVPIASGGTGQTAATSAYNALSPMTTTGDIEYESGASTASRLAGNTSAQIKFLGQAGNGSTSAAPAWSVVSGQYLCAPNALAPSSRTGVTATSTTMAAWVPPATTVAAGSNGGEISQVASWSSPSAGILDVATTTGWPATGTITVATSTTTATVTYTGTAVGQLTGCAYVSGSATGTVSTGGAVTLTSSAIYTNSFTAPASGSVIVTLYCVAQVTANGNVIGFALAAKGTITPVIGQAVTVQVPATNEAISTSVTFYVTGLTPGTSYQFDLLGATTSAGTATIQAQGQSSTALSAAGAPAVMTVLAL